MDILAFFTNNGIPATGLSPTVRIREVPAGTLVVTDAAMTEVGDGHYSYDFTGYSPQKNYAIRCFGGSNLPASERYTYAGNENYIDDVDWTIDNNTSILGISGDIQTVNTNVLTVNTNILGVSADVVIVDQKIDSVQLDVTQINTNILSLSASNQENFDTLNTNILAVSADVQNISASASVNEEAVADAVWSKVLSTGYTAESILINNNKVLGQNNAILQRIVGLVHENIYIDNPVYDGDSNLTSARLRIYSASGSTGTNQDVIGTYQITAPGDGPGRFTSWKQIRTK